MTRFFVQRWRGQVSTRVLMWRDMFLIGSALNLLVTFAALMGITQGLDARLAVALHFAPTPYNVFLVLAVWRLPRRSRVRRAVALAWLVAVTVV